AMFLNKCKMAILLISCAALLGAGLGLASLHRASAEPPKQPPKQSPAQKATGGISATAEEVVKVRGRVLGPDGKPVPAAKLYLGGHTSLKQPAYPVRATSGDDGRFAFTFSWSELQSGDAVDRFHRRGGADDPVYQVLAVAKGYGCAWATAKA